MKKLLLPLAFALVGSPAFAADETGRINFHGTVYAGGTCPIEVVDPGAGPLPWVSLGNYLSNHFKATGTSTPEVAFALRVKPDGTCKITPGSTASVKFEPLHGAIGTDLYAIRSGGATNLGVAIKDETHTKIAPNADSKDYDLYETAVTDLVFYANFESTSGTVGEGLAEAEVNFTVALP
ncbi:fimbrial protein [Pseudomonas putida]